MAVMDWMWDFMGFFGLWLGKPGSENGFEAVDRDLWGFSTSAFAALWESVARDGAEENALGGKKVALFGKFRAGGGALWRGVLVQIVAAVYDRRWPMLGRLRKKGAMPGASHWHRRS
jgi:hypothetical protein